MRRRDFAWLAAAAASVPARVPAQPARTARLGLLHDFAHYHRDPAALAMFERLAELGWSTAHNLQIEYHQAPHPSKALAELVRELVRLRCDLVVTSNTPAALAVKAWAPQLPHLFTIGGDPVALGLVDSMARPGGNTTGVTQMAIEANLKQLSLLKEMVPALARAAVMFDAGNASIQQIIASLRDHARNSRIELLLLPLRDWGDVDAALPVLRREQAQGLIVLPGSVTGGMRFSISHLAQQLQLPVVYSARFYVTDVGGLMSYGPDRNALYRRLAEQAARILGGEKPGRLPVEQPTQFELVVSLSTARAQGITVPQSVLLQANEVIR